MLNPDFIKASQEAQLLPKKPSNDELLQLYALYKQATEGDIKGEKPIGFDFKALAKYNAWEELKGLSQEDAQVAYIKLVDILK